MTFPNVLFFSLVLGVCATVLMDLWALFLKRVFNVQPLNWAMVGRWVGNMRTGHFYYESIIRAPIVKHEKVIGWLIHYITGVMLALMFLSIVGNGWLLMPTVQQAISFGLATVLLPFLIMQPCLGFGFFASQTPNPMNARMLSILAHIIFGLGLFLTAYVVVHVVGV
ncbi:DUF2938 domain-containing protein [Bermanella marisrubri]|uniref:DUF2938 domain-containing protein n=1 Tax=Bermanella marisrubri TaxID=207949 RepID=Q1N652_9GAMM|nr:DUF2938 domain-containing protein [Bermanella marisrubri]EAT13740.1 hypothetical protein RED65_10119 [Oceanobacter sp. RED65] [Bermanella marisrubri]QIZ84516.1 DUF2938 domain-containing protein [Bermanella marisrubri]